jgi:hypothetical protein
MGGVVTTPRILELIAGVQQRCAAAAWLASIERL